MKRILCVCATVVLACLSPGAAVAQQAIAADMWSRGSTVEVFGGVATADSRAGALAGGGLGWELTPRFGVDGSAAWLDRPGPRDAFAAALTAHLGVFGRRSVGPFVKGGVGLYRVSFEGPPQSLPDFYRRRLGAGESTLGSSSTFTDPTVVIGGGVNLFTTRHIALRPEIEAIVLRRDSRSHVVTAVTFRVAYHFEDHPMTPSRVRR